MIGKGLLVSEGFWYVYSKITADCKYSFERGRKMLMKHNLKKKEKKKKVGAYIQHGSITWCRICIITES